MKNLLILIFFIPVVCFSQTIYKIHSCEKKEKCIDPNPILLSFKVDIPNNKVLMQIHEGKKIIDTIIRDKEDCSVFDASNWSCKSQKINSCPLHEYKMTNGNLTYQDFNYLACNKNLREVNRELGLKEYKFWWTEKS
jgi:hypothetical protein